MKQIDDKHVEITEEEFKKMRQFYSDNILRNLNRINPSTGQSFFQSLSISTTKTTQEQLTKWLKDPKNYDQQLRSLSQFLSNNITHYYRACDHLTKILTFNYIMLPDYIPQKEADKKIKNSKTKKDKILQKLNVKKTFGLVQDKVIREGVAFYSVKELPKGIKLFELPAKYCYVTGRGEHRLTFSLDLSLFDVMNSLLDVMPELYDTYKYFCAMREFDGKNAYKYQYYPMPEDEGWVFIFDENYVDKTPPLKGAFKDAIEIMSYKDMLKTKAMIDTYLFLHMKIPYDNETHTLVIEQPVAEYYTQMTQEALPPYASAIVNPFDVEKLDFSGSKSQDNIVGVGEQNFWSSAGIAGTILGESSKSAMTLQFSVEDDYGFVEHMYRQYESFINYWLNKDNTSTELTWHVKMFGNRFTDKDKAEAEKSAVQAMGVPIFKWYAYNGYEPYEVDTALEYEKILKLKDKHTTIIPASQMSGKEDNVGGREEKEATELSDSGTNTRDYGSNEEKVKIS